MRSLSLSTVASDEQLASSEACIVVFVGAQPRRVELPHSGTWVVGRSRECGLDLRDPSLSRRHALLHFGDGLEIEDLGSTNGTRVQGQRLVPGQRTVVGSHTTIEFGDVLVVYRAPKDAGRSADMAALRRLLERAAPSPLPILLCGETGVGKTALARVVHAASRRAGPLVVVDCGAIPEALIEAQLFGHVAGAFTGADKAAIGSLAAADRGTVFLDEIGELPLHVQPKLLRALQQSEVQPVGSPHAQRYDLRFIAATCRDLERDVADGRFREDLYFRLAGLVVEVPPLRLRGDELAALANTLLRELADELHRDPPTLADDALAWLRTQPWPGNIRELRNLLQRALVLVGGDHLDAATLAQCAGRRQHRLAEELVPQRQRIADALRACAGNQTQAAKMLGISRRTLISRLDDLGVPRPRKGRE